MPHDAVTIHNLRELGPTLEMLVVTFTQGKQVSGEYYHRLVDVAGRVRELVGSETYDIAVGGLNAKWSMKSAETVDRDRRSIPSHVDATTLKRVASHYESNEEWFQRHELSGVRFASRMYQIGVPERDYAQRLGLLFAGILSAAAAQPPPRDTTLPSAVEALQRTVSENVSTIEQLLRGVAENAAALGDLESKVAIGPGVHTDLEIRLTALNYELESLQDEVNGLSSRLEEFQGQTALPSVTADQAADLREQLSEVRKQQTVLMELLVSRRPDESRSSAASSAGTDSDTIRRKRKTSSDATPSR